jgi:hypothetical protein
LEIHSRREYRSMHVSQLFREAGQRIDIAPMAELPDQGRGWNSSGLNREHQLHPVLPVPPQQLPIHCLAEERIEMAIARVGARSIQLEVLPVSDTWQQTDAEHAGKGKAHRRLALCVGAHSVGLDAELWLLQRVDDVNAFPKSRRHEMSEHRDVVIGDMPVSDRTHLAVAKMISGQQIVVVEIKLCPVSGDHGALTPGFR